MFRHARNVDLKRLRTKASSGSSAIIGNYVVFYRGSVLISILFTMKVVAIAVHIHI